jgi:3D (Asp-Asp-Asp) domain-containing protein
MTKPKVGRTIAVSHDLIHWLGGWVYISGVGIRKVEDLMNERFTLKIDLLVGTVEEAKKWGIQERRVIFLGR